MKKIRHIPDPSHEYSYKMYLHTAGTMPAAILLMEKLKEEYENGNDYFSVLGIINFYCELINEIKVIRNEKIRERILLDYLNKLKFDLTNKSYPLKIVSFASNILHAYRKKI